MCVKLSETVPLVILKLNIDPQSFEVIYMRLLIRPRTQTYAEKGLTRFQGVKTKCVSAKEEKTEHEILYIMKD